MKKIIKKISFSIIFLFVLLTTFVLFIDYDVERKGSELEKYCIESSYPKQAALVLGARVYDNGRMSGIFEDRAKTALALYQEGKVEKILVSGDHGTNEYDEVGAARDFLLENGVLSDDIFLDHAGFDTYDSIYRAKEIFGVDSVVIVTQDFHLPRANYIAQNLGIDFCGKSADLHSYVSIDYLEFRERFARVKAWFNVLLKSEPRYLGEFIDINDNGEQTWD